MLKKIDRRAFFARVCIVFSFIITFVAVPTSAYAASCTLSYSLMPNTSTISSGGKITYAVSVKNTGGGTCRDVAYSIYYAPNEKFVSATPAPKAGNYYWYIGNLGSNKKVNAIVTTRHSPEVDGTTVESEGCASGRNAADSCADSSVTITNTTQTVPTTPTIPNPATTVPVVSTPVATTPVPTVSTTTQITTTQSTSTIATSGTQSTTTTSTTQPVVLKGKEQGMWIWSFPSQMNTSAGIAQMNSVAADGFNEVYLTIDDYLNVSTLPAGANRDSQKAAYFASLAKFIVRANSLGITVDAEGGENDWQFPQNRWKGFALIDAVKEYNNLYPNAKLHGFQYDVEPHTLSDYETNKSARLTEFVSFIDESVTHLVGTDIQFGMTIPHFFDDKQAWTPAITYNGLTDYTFNQLLTVLEKKPGSKMLIMAYRNTFAGPDGTQQISQVEIQEASSGKYSTQIIVGQETGNVTPSYVTFYGSTKTSVLGMVSTIDSAFGSYSNFGGAAVHYIDSYLAMTR